MPPGAVAGGIAVVIDVLRASTTIITALAHGAVGVRPVLTIDEARALAARGGAGHSAGADSEADSEAGSEVGPDAGPDVLLGGERGGL